MTITERHAADGLVVRAMADVLDLLNFGVVLADGQGEVAFANRCARVLARETGSLSLDCRVRATRADLTARLHAHLADVLDTARRGRDAMRGMAVPHRNGRGELMLLMSALPSRDLASPRSLATIFMSDSAGAQAPPEHLLTSLFGLTPVEAQVARELVRGARKPEIARELEISETTVAFHLRNLFEKTGTHRQVELVSLFMKTFKPVA